MQINPHRYSDSISQTKVLLIGVFPPPLGGIAVHLKRVKSKLEQQGCIVLTWQVAHSSLRYFLSLVKFYFKTKPQVVIYHTLQLRHVPIELAILLIMGKLIDSKLTVVIHSARFITNMSKLNGYTTSFLLRFCHQIILVGSQLRRELEPKLVLRNRLVVIESPFLPPVLNEKQLILEQISASLNDFLFNHDFIITVAITRLDQWQGQDLYGADLALQAFALLQQDFPKAGLLIVLGNPNGKTLTLGPNSYLLSEWSYEMWPLIAKSDLFIRPTRSDCNAISVAEALWLGVPVVASDVCVRPSGTILFKSGDVQDLYEKMKQVLVSNFQLHD